MKTLHEQINVTVHGKVIAVDRGVRELILLLNSFRGVETRYSCQGNPGGAGYVLFGGEGALVLVPKLTAEILRQQQFWQRKHEHVCRGCRRMSLSLEVCDVGICLRWDTPDYREVLKMIKRAVRIAPEKRQHLTYRILEDATGKLTAHRLSAR
jgi:hypothetical protein